MHVQAYGRVTAELLDTVRQSYSILPLLYGRVTVLQSYSMRCCVCETVTYIMPNKKSCICACVTLFYTNNDGDDNDDSDIDDN